VGRKKKAKKRNRTFVGVISARNKGGQNSEEKSKGERGGENGKTCLMGDGLSDKGRKTEVSCNFGGGKGDKSKWGPSLGKRKAQVGGGEGGVGIPQLVYNKGGCKKKRLSLFSENPWGNEGGKSRKKKNLGTGTGDASNSAKGKKISLTLTALRGGIEKGRKLLTNSISFTSRKSSGAGIRGKGDEARSLLREKNPRSEEGG